MAGETTIARESRVNPINAMGVSRRTMAYNSPYPGATRDDMMELASSAIDIRAQRLQRRNTNNNMGGEIWNARDENYERTQTAVQRQRELRNQARIRRAQQNMQARLERWYFNN